LVDTGSETLTGGRIKRIKPYVNNETFMLTYGDGVGNIKIDELISFHRQHGKLCTVTSAQPSGRFGALNIDENNQVISFREKPKGDGSWINAGFFVCDPAVFGYIKGDLTTWEREPMESLAREGQMLTYKHYGFWKPMDNIRDKQELENDWMVGKAKWKIW
jgi:glucose-1-phosphate cytidylyltransferase